MTEVDRARGCLLGLACGDALGRPVEFKSAEQIASKHGRVTEMLGDGTHGQPAGTITDDTEMALCIARSLEANGEFDGADVADRFVEWYQSGPFDIGLMTRDALSQIEAGGNWQDVGQQVWERKPEGSNAGNGSLMRSAPYALAYADDPERLTEVSIQSSGITHADPRCTYGCALLNHCIAAFLNGDESDPVETALDTVGRSTVPAELQEAVLDVDEMDESKLQPTGYVVHTLQSGLFHALRADSAEEAIISAVNQGGDADTHGAVAGALAGARFGVESLPDRWIEAIPEASELRRLADSLVEL